MDNLKAKIEKTSLFAPEAKIRLLAHLSELPEGEQKVLEHAIDEFEAKITKLAHTFRKEVSEQITALKADAASEEQKDVDDATKVFEAGLDLVAPTL